jgi:hypothetical protein
MHSALAAQVRGFDGHGPTWTTLVELGIKHFPGATVSCKHACVKMRV